MKEFLFRYWKPFSLPITIALGVLTFLWVQRSHDAELEQARQDVAVANHTADLAIDVMQVAIAFADSVQAQADSIAAAAAERDRQRASRAPAVARIVAQAPDTCRPVIAALQGQLANAEASAGEWKSAYEKQLEATAKLQAAAGPLVDASKDQTKASEHLADASRRSFWQTVTPKLGINATIGIDPTQPEDGIKKVVGVGASWTF